MSECFLWVIVHWWDIKVSECFSRVSWVRTWVDLLDCRACLERAFLWDSDSSSLTGVRYDLKDTTEQM